MDYELVSADETRVRLRTRDGYVVLGVGMPADMVDATLTFGQAYELLLALLDAYAEGKQVCPATHGNRCDSEMGVR